MRSDFLAREVHSVDQFLQLSREVRASEPIATQIIGGAAAAVAKGTSSYERCTWWVIESDGKVVGLAMHTEPFNLFLSPMPLEASLALAKLIVAEHPGFPGVNGPSEVVKPFLSKCAELSTKLRKYELHQEHLTYSLIELISPLNSVGEVRLATPEDKTLVLQWFTAFAHEADVENHNLEAVVDRATATERLYLWSVDGVIVSMAGHTASVEIPGGTLARIGPVYTPPEYRKHGYASFLVAEISRRLHARGVSVMLYADAKNPASNNVYIKIGFSLVGSNTIWNISWK